MQHKSRLTGNKRFSQIHQEGTSAANRFLVIRFLANGLDQSRFGILTSKRIGNAVVRNRVKRRLREAIRSSRIRSGWDALFIARRGSDKGELRRTSSGHSQLAPAQQVSGHQRRRRSRWYFGGRFQMTRAIKRTVILTISLYQKTISSFLPSALPVYSHLLPLLPRSSGTVRHPPGYLDGVGPSRSMSTFWRQRLRSGTVNLSSDISE